MGAHRRVDEFWIDRAIMAVIMTGGTVTLALVPGLRNYLVADFAEGRACVQLRSWLPLEPRVVEPGLPPEVEV